jgi:hypothetical protein
MVDWIQLALACAVVGAAWDFDAWKKAHPNAEPKARTSQSGKAELEPLLAATRSQPAVRDCAGWERRRAPFARALRAILGTLPSAKPPINAQLLEESETPAWVQRKVSYAGEPGETITAYLFIPRKRAKRAPAMICLHQTVRPGKREASGLEGDASLAFAPQLAERGYVTLAPDAICFGERYHAGEPYKHYGDAVPFYETHPDASIMGKMAYDVGRAIDYLQTLSFVDPARIGSIGHSHGAYGTIFAMLVEPRLRVGIESCGFTSFRTDPGFDRWYRRTALLPALGFFERRVQDTPLDFHQILALIAPRPLFVSGALKDAIFPGTENLPWIVDQVRSVYALYGQPDNFEAYLFDGEHHFTPEAQRRAFAFLDRQIRLRRGSR